MKENKPHFALKNIFSENPLLSLGLAISPAVIFTDSAENAALLALMVTALTFVTVLISSFIPRTIVYTSRVILYTLIAALMFVPVYIGAEKLFPVQTADMGILAPLLITNPFIVSLTEHRFFKEDRKTMAADCLTLLLGYDIVVLLIGVIRELFTKGGIGGRLYGIALRIPSLEYPFGVFILIGLAAAAVKAVKGRNR